MDTLFLPGPFADSDLLCAILGAEPPDPGPEAARLPDHTLRALPDGAVVCLVPEQGATVTGAVFVAGPATRARIAHGFAAFGAAVEPVTVGVVTADGPRPALAWLAAGSAPAALCPSVPDAEWRAHLVEAAAEAMALGSVHGTEAVRALMAGISYRALARVRGAAMPGPQGPRSPLTLAGDVETRAVERPYTAFFAVEEHVLRHRRFDGGWSPELRRAVFASGDAVTVLPFDPGRRAVLLIEQFRPAAVARRDPRPWFLEPVAGRCDAGESAEATARREAREEAGRRLGRLERVAGFYPSPGVSAEFITAYVGEADLGDAGGLHGRDHQRPAARLALLARDRGRAAEHAMERALMGQDGPGKPLGPMAPAGEFR
jgi:ADP-ribose pyrophosphatase